jgi:hypothetical protein
MRLSGSEFNIRILYGFLPSGKPVLLLAFYERSGKRASDYTNNIFAAKKRLTEILEETDHECE